MHDSQFGVSLTCVITAGGVVSIIQKKCLEVLFVINQLISAYPIFALIFKRNEVNLKNHRDNRDILTYPFNNSDLVSYYKT